MYVCMQWRAEDLGCPVPTRFLDAHIKKFVYQFISQKFLTTFLVVSANFTYICSFLFHFDNLSPKNSDYLFLVLLPNISLILNRASFGCPLILDARGRPLSSLIFFCIFSIYLHFFEENSVVGCGPGAVALPPQPLPHMGGDLAPNLGDQKIFSRPNFKKNVNFQGKNF